MVGKKWTLNAADPDDIIGAARTIGDGTGLRLFHDPIPDWVPAADYLAWARRGLEQDDFQGRDVAVCYAKRAVCRYIDALMINNHLKMLSGRTYKDKIDLLDEIGISIPNIVHELVINARNDIEHSYHAATAVQASRAVELADLLLDRTTTVEELPKKALISLGSNVELRIHDQPPDRSEVRFSVDEPWLLVDTLAQDPRVMILHPKNDEIQYTNIGKFYSGQTVRFARLMRERQKPSPIGLNRSMSLEGGGLQGLLYLMGLAPRPADGQS